jgi:hypothetical protein
VRGAYMITGRITRRDTNDGVHGLLVEAWDDDWRCDDCLGSDLTNRDGSFRIAFREDDFSESFKGRPEVYLKIGDRDLRLISDTRSDKCRCEPGEVTEFNLSLVPDILWWHFSCPIRRSPRNVDHVSRRTRSNTSMSGTATGCSNRPLAPTRTPSPSSSAAPATTGTNPPTTKRQLHSSRYAGPMI